MIFSSLIKKNLTKISINIFKHNLDVKLINIHTQIFYSIKCNDKIY